MNRRFPRFLARSALVSAALITSACSTEVDPSSTADLKGGAASTTSRTEEAPLALANSEGYKPMIVKGDFATASAATQSGFQASLAKASKAFGVKASELSFVQAERDELGMSHARYTQSINGIPVVNSDLRLHANAQGKVFLASGSVAQSAALPTTAQIDAEFAASLASTEARPGLQLTIAGETDLVYIVTHDHAGAHLAWRTTVVGTDVNGMPIRDEVFVDAVSSDVVARLPQVHSARDRKTYTANNTSSTPGTLVRRETDAAVADIDVNAAHDNLGLVYDYYFDTFGRDSYDASGATLVATVHYSRNYCNAYWDGTQMVYGDGDGRDCGPLARGLDVAGHELTHAVTEHSAGLEYSGESGGLNEAMSDIFGNVIEAKRDGGVSQNTWLVGEEIWTPSVPGDALRYMDDPAKDGSSLDYYPDFDGQDVHYSSGIANLAFKLLTTGGPHPRGRTTTVAVGIGLEKAAAIFYRALTKYETPTTNFEAARQATAQAAADLYDAETVAAVHLAWDALAVPGGPNAPQPPPAVQLENGVAQDISGAKKAKLYFDVVVPAGKTLTVKTSGGTGDADLYVAFGRKPSSVDNDGKSEGGTTAETVTATRSEAGTYTVMVVGYTAFSGASIVATF